MSSTGNPGFADQARKRTIIRIVGFVLLAAGLVVAVKGGMAFYDGATSDSVDDSSGFAGVLLLAAGGFLVVFGLGALNAGFMGASARYAAGETMPVVKDSASYLTEGQGILGVGRTVDDRPGATSGATVTESTATGPYCSRCGVRNDADAKFCDSCGSSLG